VVVEMWVKEEEEEDDKWGPHVGDRGELLQKRIRICIHMHVGLSEIYTYFVAFLWEQYISK
jgi:hypothetical protein